MYNEVVKRKGKRKPKIWKLALTIIFTGSVALWTYNLKGAIIQYYNDLQNTSMQDTSKNRVLADEAPDFVVSDHSDIYTGNLILVNNSLPFEFPDESDIISVFNEKNQSYKVSEKDISLTEPVIRNFNEMMSDFEKAEKIDDIIIVSGYRTIEDQARILKEKISQLGKADAEKWAARPGFSEHHTGLSMDIGIYRDNGQSQSYTGSGKYNWINENCGNYGFILRYSGDKAKITGISNEPWHYRFVGKPHANIIKSKGFCLEEYIDYLKNSSSSSKHLYFTDYDGTRYEIYYVKASGIQTRISIPQNCDYSISGNNEDGFIVTFKK